jgi:hypothetical protein
MRIGSYNSNFVYDGEELGAKISAISTAVINPLFFIP